MKKKHSTATLVFVLLVVLIICGGNAVGILVGAIIWTASGRMVPAVTALVVISIAAFAVGMALVALNHRRIAEEAKALQKQEAEEARAAQKEEEAAAGTAGSDAPEPDPARIGAAAADAAGSAEEKEKGEADAPEEGSGSAS